MNMKHTTYTVLTDSSRSCYVTRTRQRFIEDLLQRGLPYSRKLSMHSSCVNALTFSNDGRWLASAGDDTTIYLWDFNQDDLTGPSHSFRGPRDNIFALAFSASRRHLYSGDTDFKIYRYDMTRLSTSPSSSNLYSQSFAEHEEYIRSISCHPELDDVFLSASENGKILLHDGRAESHISKAQATLRNTSEFTGVQYHPTIPHLFVTGDKAGHAHLRDIRMAFGPLSSRSNEGIVQTYVTSISKPSVSHLCQPEIGSLTFDRTDHHLTRCIADPFPVAVCSGRLQPDGSAVPHGERSYSNCCTIKHGSFGGPGLDNDSYYAAGSDDFRSYVWRLPPVAALVEEREFITAQQWGSADADVVGFAASATDERYIPKELSQPLCRLGGHRSIVNSTLWHPHWPYLVSAGVERHIRLHSPTSCTPCGVDIPLTPRDVRSLPSPNIEDRHRMMRALILGRDEDGYDGDLQVIALFDEILRNEGSMDVFASRRWSPDLDDDSDDSEGPIPRL